MTFRPTPPTPPTPAELQAVARFMLDEYAWRPQEADRYIGDFMNGDEDDYQIGNWVSPEVRGVLCNIDPEGVREGLKRLYETHPFHIVDNGTARPAVHPLLNRLANLLAAPSPWIRGNVAEALQHGSYAEYEKLEDSGREHFTLDLLVQAWSNLIALLVAYFESDGCIGDTTKALCTILNATRGAC